METDYKKGQLEAIAFTKQDATPVRDQRAKVNQAKCPSGEHYVKPSNGKRGFCRKGGDGSNDLKDPNTEQKPTRKKKTNNRGAGVAMGTGIPLGLLALGGAIALGAASTANTEKKISEMERENYNNQQQRTQETVDELRREQKRQEERDKKMEEIRKKAQAAQDEFKRQWDEASKKAQEKSAEYTRQQSEKANNRNANRGQQQERSQTNNGNSKQGYTNRGGASQDEAFSTLGVDKNASPEEIKKAHRKLVKQYHPDLNPNNKEAEEQFKRINNAFEVISKNMGQGKRLKRDSLGYQTGYYDLNILFNF
jgi:DnaJ-domain-containing protein 1